MALTYTYKITGLRKRNQVNADGDTLEGAVIQTYWECHGTDENGNTAHFTGANPLTAENVPAGEFRPFEELTEEVVIGWIKAHVEAQPGYLEHIEERIREQIDSVNITDAPLPWAPEQVTPTPGAPAEDAVPEAQSIPDVDDSSANTAP